MKILMNYRSLLFAICALFLLTPSPGLAETQDYCVICSDPDQTYRCQLNTLGASSGNKGMQLYCIIRLSKDGGHKSCAVRAASSAVCEGPVRTYAFTAPAIPSKLKNAADKIRNSGNGTPDIQETPANQNEGEPKTLFEMTGRAVKASRKGVKNTRQAVGGAAGATTRKVGNAARGAGKGVTKGAQKVGAATRKTGSAVGNAAKTALNCLKSWFKECGTKPEVAPSQTQ